MVKIFEMHILREIKLLKGISYYFWLYHYSCMTQNLDKVKLVFMLRTKQDTCIFPHLMHQ